MLFCFTLYFSRYPLFCSTIWSSSVKMLWIVSISSFHRNDAIIVSIIRKYSNAKKLDSFCSVIYCLSTVNLYKRSCSGMVQWRSSIKIEPRPFNLAAPLTHQSASYKSCAAKYNSRSWRKMATKVNDAKSPLSNYLEKQRQLHRKPGESLHNVRPGCGGMQAAVLC